MNSSSARSHVTLGLCTILHALTHAFGQALVPLYLLIVADLKLDGVRKASLIVTIYGFVYCVASYLAGILADRFNRKTLLTVGLIGNSLALIAMGLVRQYEMLIVLAVLAGLFGTLFHPAANALAPAHFPKSPGMAIGLLGMGSGLGFWLGPQYAGWRAETASWHWGLIADWQRPCIELGLFGLVVGLIFVLFAREVRSEDQKDSEDGMLPNRVAIEAIVTDIRGEHARVHPALLPRLRNQVLAIGAVLSMRDFVGIATISLLSIYLQKSYGYNVKQAGTVVGSMMLLSIAMNPLAVYLSAGERRLKGLAFVLVGGAATLLVVPFLPVGWVLPVMCIFQSFQFSSYAISDAALLERVASNVRGRVVGLFLTLAGTVASLSPWAMGWWTDLLGNRAADPIAYLPIFATLSGMMLLASASCPLIRRLGDTASTPVRDLPSPSMEPAG